jgi:hypothetical protein
MTGPAVYDLQAKYAAQAREPFRFLWADREWVLPHLGELDFTLQVQIEEWSPKDTNLDTINAFFVKIFGPEQADEWARTNRPIGMIFMLFADWLAHSGAEPGESPASDGSSTSTEATSRQTSGGSTASGSRKRSSAGKPPAKRAPRKAAKAAPSAEELAALRPANSST